MQFADLITLRYAGEPRGKGRPRSRIASTRNGRQFIAVYTPTETRRYESEIRAVAFEVMRGRSPLDGPLHIQIVARFSVPESWSKKKKDEALAGLRRPGKPDLDNVQKAATDALNGIVYLDDAQIVECHASKFYGEPGLEITIKRIVTPLFERPADELESPAEPEPAPLSYAEGAGSTIPGE